ncbi:MAG: sugar phosphate isomerase/epimerase [Armatimonadetes bacterium]|nr:sugar phosphate isomerase/epimerase [Armatimonadota bacterium]
MKLGVSTLGCPDWTLEQILSRCKAYGYDGIEWRGLGPDLDLTQSPAFATPKAIARTRRAIADAGLESCGIDTSVRLADEDDAAWQENLELAQRTIELADELGAPHVRVFGGDGQAARVVEALRLLSDFTTLASGDVLIVLETHDAFSTGAQVGDVMRRVEHPRVRALWDLHHPYRHGETPEQTWQAIGPYVQQTHVKDSVPGGTYCLLGEGDIPIKEMLGLLVRGGYRRWVNLEWEKRWIPALADPEVAFPQYARTLRQYLAELAP